MVKFVVLLNNGDIKDIEIKLKLDDRNKELKNLIRYTKKLELFTKNIKVGKGKITEIHNWKIKDNKLVAYGYLKGHSENNHELPITEEVKFNKYYDDIIIFKVTNNNILLDITTSQYEACYNELYYNKNDISELDNNISDEEQLNEIEDIDLDLDLDNEINDEYANNTILEEDEEDNINSDEEHYQTEEEEIDEEMEKE